MTIIEALTAWLKTCPELEGGYINIDWLPPDARACAVEVIPCQEVVKRYLRGAADKQFLFYLTSREFLGEDIRDAQDNHAFYESFAAWVKQQNKLHNLPDLGERRTARAVYITTSGYPMQVSDDGKARYQIQLRLEYFEKA